MALTKIGIHWYGEIHDDIHESIIDYSTENGYQENLATHFADAVCTCGNFVFSLLMDEDAGVAIRICANCNVEHPIGDSAEYMDDAEVSGSLCVCNEEEFEITIGVTLYADSEDVRWLYVGCRCVKCGITGVWGDWKNEYIGYKDLLAKV